LFQELERRGILKSALLSDHSFGRWHHSIRAPPLILSIQRNAMITRVRLFGVLLSGHDVAGLIGNSPSISTFEMNQCRIESQESAVAIAAALERSTTIESPALEQLSESFVAAILEGLLRNWSVKKLTYQQGRRGNNEDSRAFAALLTSTTTIEELKLKDENIDMIPL